MLSLQILALPMLSILLLPHPLVARPSADHAMVVAPVDAPTLPGTQLERRDLVYGLPPGWTAVFKTVTSIQPPLVNPAFIQFFSAAAKLAMADPVPGRRVQRIPFGALLLEFVAKENQNQVVTREFVVAASMWLLDTAQKGWTGFFEAWVRDNTNGDIIFIRLTNVFDHLMSSSS